MAVLLQVYGMCQHEERANPAFSWKANAVIVDLKA